MRVWRGFNFATTEGFQGEDMAAELIFYPAIAMFALSMFVLFRTGMARAAAVKQREVPVNFYRLYQGEEPEHLRLLSRHLQNQFEVPPLFYMVVVALYATGLVTPLSLIGAWLFVALRLLHSYVHLNGNVVMRRFMVFIASTVALILLWVYLLIGLLAR